MEILERKESSVKLDSEQLPSSTKEDSRASQTSSSFASLRKSRDGKKTFVSPRGVGAISSAGETSKTLMSAEQPEGDLRSSSVSQVYANSEAVSSSSVTSSSSSIMPTSTSRSTSTPTASKARRSPSQPQDPLSTIPGSGIRLLKRLNESQSPSEASTLLSFYKPEILITILDGLLEPDTLAQILVALEYTLFPSMDTETETDENPQKQWVMEVMHGLKRTKRFGMNRAMLSKIERDSGDRVWQRCGGVGSWV